MDWLAVPEGFEYLTDGIEDEVLESDPVLSRVGYRSFVSRSKGRKRRRKGSKEIELIGYAGRWFEYRDGMGKVDEIASEVLRGTTEDWRCESELLRRLRCGTYGLS